jgi:hypothetical protein
MQMRLECLAASGQSGRVKRAGVALLGCIVALFVLASLVVTVTAAPADEYETRRDALEKDLAKEHYELGLWCMDQGITEAAQEHFERALALAPEHAEAAQKLAGLARPGGRAKPPDCEVRLVNNDMMKAEMLTTAFQLDTACGFLLVPAADVDLIRFGRQTQPDYVVSDVYSGEGRIKEETFSARSMVGPITLRREHLSSIRILRPCPACDGKGQATCRRCAGTGRVTERSLCPGCEGKGWVACGLCNGQGETTCPRCGGSGRRWGRGGGGECARCQGTGKNDCPQCDGGHIVCPTCKGKPASIKAGPCPVCNGKKTVRCEPCGGSGTKPLPGTEAGNPAKEGTETPAPAGPAGEQP